MDLSIVILYKKCAELLSVNNLSFPLRIIFVRFDNTRRMFSVQHDKNVSLTLVNF